MGEPVSIGSILASGAVGLGNTLFSNILGRSNMNKQVEQSKELMDYQWNRFQSPQAQVSELAKAGLNPLVAFGKGGSQLATPSPSSVSSPSYAPVDLSAGLDTISNYVKSVADAKKAGMDTKLSEQEILNKEVERQRNEFQLSLEKEFGRHDWTSKIANEYMKLILASDQSDIYEQEKALNEFKIAISDLEKQIKGDEREMVSLKLKNLPTVIRLENRVKEKEGDMYQAKANESNASAFEHKQRGNLIISQKEEQDFYNLVRTDPDVRISLIKQMRSFGVAAERQNTLTSKQIELMDFAISQAAYADDMKEYTYWIDKCTSILTSAATVGGAAGLLKHYSQLDKALGSPKVSETVNFNAYGEKMGSSVTSSNK